MLRSLEPYLRKHHLVSSGERVGVAVSGGADSVALLRAFAELAPALGIVPFVLHLNHNLRGAASQSDERFVLDLAAQLSLDCAVESEDVASLATLLHLSIEAAGRRARYAFFQRAALAHRLQCVATAHTRDDQAETVLLRLLRGTGTTGLAGVHRNLRLSQLSDPPVPEDEPLLSPRLIRPLLAISRRQVEQYLQSIGQSFCQDASNLSPQFLRNRVRAELLPALERDYNPRLRQALSETAEVAAAENDFLDAFAANILSADPEPGLSLPALIAQPLAVQRRMLRHLCRPCLLALDFAQLEALREFALAGRAGELRLPRQFTASIVRSRQSPSRLFLRPPQLIASSLPYSFELPIPGAVCIASIHCFPDLQIKASLLSAGVALQAYNHVILLRSVEADRSLIVRSLLPGDRFRPLHSGAEQKIARLLQGLCVPATLRQSWPVVSAGERIVWVPGVALAANAAWAPGDGEAIVLEMQGGEGTIFHGQQRHREP